MKKWINVFLLLPLILAVGFIILAYSTGSAPNWFATATATLRNTIIPSATPVITSATPRLTSTILPPRTVQLTSTPTKRTDTATPTFTSDQNASKIATGTSASEEISVGISRGNEIIRVLEIYNLDQGHYPPSLDNLVPNYISEIPVTSTGQSYFYRLFDPTDQLASEIYWLSFRAADQGHTVCTYYRRLESWDCNFASP
jgi:hypothetical protein